MSESSPASSIQVNSKQEKQYCSVEASLAEAPLHGTAVEVHYWLLIEYSRPWKPKALLENELSDALNQHMARLPAALAQLNGQKLRVQFIKQAASADRTHPKIFIARGIDNTALFEKVVEQLSDLTTLTAQQIIDPPSAGFRAVEESIALVCTNGQRDVCCAKYGLPVYESLRSELGQRAWQTTHVGGHRYAPNVLALPSGLLHGFVTAEEAPTLVNKLDDGTLTLHRLRGRSTLSPVSQAAEYFISLGRNQKQDGYFSWVEETELAEEREPGKKTYAVQFQDEEGNSFVVKLLVSMSEPVLASCEGKPKPVNIFEMIEIA